MFFSVTCRL
jgi:hypothetical protein